VSSGSATDPEIFVYPDEDAVAVAGAERLLSSLAAAQHDGRTASVVLTGGGVGTKLLAAVAASAHRARVDWRRVDFWWGDERFVPADDPERNERAARITLLDALDVDPARVHPMGSSDEFATPEAAAAAYAAELTKAKRDRMPAFDVLLLGMGPEGHVASLFPDQPAASGNGLVVAVHGCPKPPPTRVSLTFEAIGEASEVWLVVSGTSKAEAVAMALSGAPRLDVPAAGARGSQRTILLLDEGAASELPPELTRSG
jgi:6-phosphogluconolactonase